MRRGSGWAAGSSGLATGGVAPVWAELDGNNQIQARYLSKDALDAVFARLAAGSSGGVTWNLTDRLGSVRGVMNNSGQLVNSLSYDAFGVSSVTAPVVAVNSEVTAPGVGDRFRYAGYQYDAATGLYYVGARWYDPSQGRWLSRDPLGFEAGDVNLYRYGFNSPTNGTDPTGLDFWSWLFGPSNQEPPEPFSSRWWDRVRSGRAYQGGPPLSDSNPSTYVLPWVREAQQWQERERQLRALIREQERNSLTGPVSRHEERVAGSTGSMGEGNSEPLLYPIPEDFHRWSRGDRMFYLWQVRENRGVPPAPPPSAVQAWGPGGWAWDIIGLVPVVAPRAVRGRGVPRHLGSAAYEITFGHGARHLEGTSFSQAEVENAIENVLRANPNVGHHWGWIQVNGQWFQYRVHVLPDGTINVGTYFPVSGPLRRK
jgi:RHS repeat-associated protein